MKISPDIDERTKETLEVQYMGYYFTIPITDRMMKILKKHKGWDVEKAFRDVISALYIQVRDVVGAEIKSEISNQIADGFTKIFDKKLDEKITNGFEMLEDKSLIHKHINVRLEVLKKMNYDENKIDWKEGDIVIHDADAKRVGMLMVVTNVCDKSKLIETEYFDMNNSDLPSKKYLNDKKFLHDPKRFNILIPICDTL